MKKCPYCAEEIQDSAKKCRFCGERLKELKNNKPIGGKNNRNKHLCPDCGSLVNEFQEKCNNCGAKLIWKVPCPDCNSSVNEFQEKCNNCGSELVWKMEKKPLMSKNLKNLEIVIGLILIIRYLIHFSNTQDFCGGVSDLFGCISSHPDNFGSGIFGVIIGVYGIILYLINWINKNKRNPIFRKKWSTRVRLVILAIIWLGLFVAFYQEMPGQ